MTASALLDGCPLPQSPVLVSRLDDLTVMGDAVQKRRRHLGVPEDLRPFAKAQVGGNHHRRLLVELWQQKKEQLPAGSGERSG